MRVDPAHRLTATEMLHHPWITVRTRLLNENIEFYKNKNKLHIQVFHSNNKILINKISFR